MRRTRARIWSETVSEVQDYLLLQFCEYPLSFFVSLMTEVF